MLLSSSVFGNMEIYFFGTRAAWLKHLMFLQTVGEAIAARAAEEEGNAMKALENRTLDSKREMDIMSALDELQSLNRRQVHVDTGAAIAALQRSIGDSDGEVRSFASILP